MFIQSDDRKHESNGACYRVFIVFIFDYQPGESGVIITQSNTSPNNENLSNTNTIATMKSIQFLSAALVLSRKCGSASAGSLLRRRGDDQEATNPGAAYTSTTTCVKCASSAGPRLSRIVIPTRCRCRMNHGNVCG